MDFKEIKLIRNALLIEKIKCLQSIDNRTIEDDYDLFFCIEKLKQGNDCPVISKGNKEYFRIVEREVQYIYDVIAQLNKRIRIKLLKRLYLLNQQRDCGLITKEVSLTNEEYLNTVLMPELADRENRSFISKRANAYNKIKLYYLKEEIELRTKAISMEKTRGVLSTKKFVESQWDSDMHFKIKEKKFNKFHGDLKELLAILENDYQKLVDKKTKDAINQKIKMFKTECTIFAQEEFINAYLQRKTVL